MTAEGQAFCGRCKELLVAIDEAESELLLPQYTAIELGVYAVYPSRKYLPLKTRRLIDFLVESFRNPPWAQHRTQPWTQ